MRVLAVMQSVVFLVTRAAPHVFEGPEKPWWGYRQSRAIQERLLGFKGSCCYPSSCKRVRGVLEVAVVNEVGEARYQ